ncbi:MAG: alpha/beta hydrolase [Pirellulaceae bacterium]|nr:alpha/beta hydrolase [Pirellulaceae bacterium]
MKILAHESYIEMDGGRLFVRRWDLEGSAKVPILLLHDSLGSVEQWRRFPEELARSASRTVVAYDRLGFGKSSARNASQPPDFIVTEGEIFIPAICNALGIAQCILLGHSVGGAMAIVAAALHPDLCTAVITEAAQSFVEQRTLDGIQAVQAEFDLPEQFARLTKWHGDKARWVLDAWTGTWLSSDFWSWNLDSYLQQVTCPVLAIHGDADEYGSIELPRRIVRQVAGPSQLAILEHCGHIPHRDLRDEVLRLIVNFLKSVESQ